MFMSNRGRLLVKGITWLNDLLLNWENVKNSKFFPLQHHSKLRVTNSEMEGERRRPNQSIKYSKENWIRIVIFLCEWEWVPYYVSLIGKKRVWFIEVKVECWINMEIECFIFVQAKEKTDCLPFSIKWDLTN